MARSVVVLSASRIYRPTEVVAGVLSVHGHFIVVGADGRTETILLVAGAGHGQEVDDEAPDVEDVAERDDPLEDGGFVDFAAALQHTEGDGEAALKEDEAELDPEADGEDTVFLPVDAETLVLGADEDG